jgi:F420-dependent oxidoreductase-like protein
MTPFFAYHMPSFTFPGVTDDALFDHAASLARAAEDAGFEIVTVMDHLYQIPIVGPESAPMLEAYSALAGLAARTRRARLGTLVTGVTYRNPALLAKMVTTLDVISRGRALLGIGAAWHEVEHEGYGVDFPPVGERMDRLDEALTICRLMFTEDRPSFQGRHYRIDRAINRPRPLQPGGPRILVGGGGERRTLRLVARHADMSHWFGSLDDLRRKTEVLERHCEAEGRDPSTITRTITAPVVPVEDVRTAGAVLQRVPPQMREGMAVVTPAEAAERLQPYLDAGFAGFFLSDAALPTPDSLGPATELIRLVRGA